MHPSRTVREIEIHRLLLLGVCALFLCLPAVAQTDEPSAADRLSEAAGGETDWPSPESLRLHQEEVAKWRASRDADLRKSEGWLSLVGLFWLHEGRNTLGSDAANDLVLPDNTPARVGNLQMAVAADGTRTITFEPAVEVPEVEVDGAPVEGLAELVTDADGKPTMVEVGALVFYLIERRGDVAVRVKDRESPLIAAFEGMDYYPIDWDWRVVAQYLPYEEPKEIQVPNILGGSDPAEVPGAVYFERDGARHKLDALPSGEDVVFLIFGDATNGKETYGAGRFLYAQVESGNLGVAGRVVLDFNMAYNPPCVFTPWATCPLPPEGNELEVAVEAGERMYEAAAH